MKSCLGIKQQSLVLMYKPSYLQMWTESRCACPTHTWPVNKFFENSALFGWNNSMPLWPLSPVWSSAPVSVSIWRFQVLFASFSVFWLKLPYLVCLANSALLVPNFTGYSTVLVYWFPYPLKGIRQTRLLLQHEWGTGTKYVPFCHLNLPSVISFLRVNLGPFWRIDILSSW